MGKIGNFRYFPSFSVGGFGDALRQDFKFNDGFSCRFYSDEFPKKYRHREFLISAGHFLKRPDLYGEHGFTSKNVVMGDSGGFQIASGALKWNPEITPKSSKLIPEASQKRCRKQATKLTQNKCWKIRFCSQNVPKLLPQMD